MKFITDVTDIKKTGQPIVAITCYSYSMAVLLKRAEIDIVLVGDSLGMVELGYENTLPVTIEEMIHHTKAVKRSQPEALLVTDMPFMTYNIDPKETLRAAGRIIKDGGAQAVKLEGGVEMAPVAEKLILNNIPVMGHVGLTPQSVHKMGGYKVQGKDPVDAKAIINDAKALEEAGVFSIVLEGIPSELAGDITQLLEIPTIGIGAGPSCDGQILVINDMLGLNPDFCPKFVRSYENAGERIVKALQNYASDVRSGSFPSEDESY
jgi:3-methyl-2-oxobutanoate hydroxymethyltransferase